MKSPLTRLPAAVAVCTATVLVSACSSTSGSSAAGAGATSTAATSAPASTTNAPASSSAAGSSPAPATSTAASSPAAAGGCAAFTQYGKLKGKQISVYSTITAPEGDAYVASFKQFEKCTGATVNYQADKDFEAQIKVRVAAGAQPDIAFVPQPGLLADLVKTGKVKPAPAAVATEVDKYFGKNWRGLGTVNGALYAAPLDASLKSLVWYSPKAFAAKRYTVPTTWDQMLALSDKIVADNPDGKAKPWCAGFSSGAATGWPGTDWMEDVMLRAAGPDVYDQWVQHKIPFNDPKVAEVLGKVGGILKNPKYVNGGLGDASSIATTTFQDAGQGIVKGSCFLYRQGSFYGSMLPKGTKISSTGDAYAFYLPPIDPSKGKPALGSGDFVAAFADRPEVAAFQTYLASPDWANFKAKASSGWLSPNTGLKVANLSNPADALSEKILQDPATIFRFDGSDQMPAAVGGAGGSFLKGMVDWVTGQSDKDTLDAIEAAWPKA